MRGSCNYKNKNKNHKRSTGGEGRGVKKKNQHGTGLSTTPRITVNRDKNSVGGESEWDKREKREKKSAVKQKNDKRAQLRGCDNAGGTQWHTVQSSANTHAHTGK